MPLPKNCEDRIYTAAIRVVDWEENTSKVPRQRVKRKKPQPINATQFANQTDQEAPQTSQLPPVSLTPALQTPALPPRLHPNGNHPPVKIAPTAPAAPTPQPPKLQQSAALDQFPFALRAQAYLRQLAVTLQEAAPLSKSGFPLRESPLPNPLSMNRSPHLLTQNSQLLQGNPAPNVNVSGMLTTQTNQDLIAMPLLLKMITSSDDSGSDLQIPETSQTAKDGPSSSTPQRATHEVGGLDSGAGSRFNPSPMNVANTPMDSAPNDERTASSVQGTPALPSLAASHQFPFPPNSLSTHQQMVQSLQGTTPPTQSGFPLPGPPLPNPLLMNRPPHPLTQSSHPHQGNSAPNKNASGMLTTQTNQDLIAMPLLLKMLTSSDGSGSDLQVPGTSQTPQDGPSSSNPQRSWNGDSNVGGVIVGNGNELSTGAPEIRAVSRFNPPPMTVTNAPIDLPQSNRSATNAEPAAPPIQRAPTLPSLAASHQFPFSPNPLSTHQQMVQSLQGTTPPTPSGFPLPGPSSQDPFFPNFLQLLASNTDLLQGSSSGIPIPSIVAQRTDQSRIVTAQQQTIDRLRRERNEWRDTAQKISAQLKIFQKMALQGTAQQDAIKEKVFQLAILSAAVNGNLPAADLEARLKQATEEVKKKMMEQKKEKAAKELSMQKDGMGSSGEPSTSAAAMADNVEKPEEEEGELEKQSHEEKSTRKRRSDGHSLEEKKSKSCKPDDSN